MKTIVGYGGKNRSYGRDLDALQTTKCDANFSHNSPLQRYLRSQGLTMNVRK